MLRAERAVPAPAAVAGNLPADRAAMTTQPPGDLTVVLVQLDADTDLLPVRLGQLAPSWCALA